MAGFLTEELGLSARLDLVHQAAVAVGHAHQQGVVHRDLKPSNVLVTAEGHARVADFGLAWHEGADTLTASGTVVGTPHYMAPEHFGIVKGSIRDQRVDVWALGVMLYQAVALTLPFDGKTPVELMASVSRPPPRLQSDDPGFSRAIGAVCAQALQLQPEARYADAGAMADALGAALAAGDSQRGAKPVLAWVGVAIGVLALVAAGSLFPLRPEAASDSPVTPGSVDPIVPSTEPKKRSVGWALSEGQSWATTYGYHSDETREGEPAKYDMQYSLRFRVTSADTQEARIRVALERLQFAMREGDGATTMRIDSHTPDDQSTDRSRGVTTIRIPLPSELAFSVRMAIPSGRVESVRGATAIRKTILAHASQLERLVLEKALQDLDDDHLREFFDLQFCVLPSAAAAEASTWKRVAAIHPAGLLLRVQVRARWTGAEELTWESVNVVDAAPGVHPNSLRGRIVLKDGRVVESRADLKTVLNERNQLKQVHLSFILGGDRPSPVDAVSGSR
jgi:hypothetical protein